MDDDLRERVEELERKVEVLTKAMVAAATPPGRPAGEWYPTLQPDSGPDAVVRALREAGMLEEEEAIKPSGVTEGG